VGHGFPDGSALSGAGGQVEQAQTGVIVAGLVGHVVPEQL